MSPSGPTIGEPEKSEEDRMANWGWGLGLIIPIFGLVIGAILIARGDRRGPMILAWSLITPIVFAALLISGTF